MDSKIFIVMAAPMSLLIAAQAPAANPGKAGIVAATVATTATFNFAEPASNGGRTTVDFSLTSSAVLPRPGHRQTV